MLSGGAYSPFFFSHVFDVNQALVRAIITIKNIAYLLPLNKKGQDFDQKKRGRLAHSGLFKTQVILMKKASLPRETADYIPH